MELFVTRVVKFFLQVISVLILIYGIFLVVSGLMIVHDLRSFSHFLESKSLWLPYFVVFNGFMMVVLTAFGFWATHRQDYKLLVTFVISAIVVLLIEMAVVTWVSADTPAYGGRIELALNKTSRNYPFVATDWKAWNQMQRRMRCCGIQGPDTWKKIFTKETVPGSCCKSASDKDQCLAANKQEVYQQGCLPTLYKRIGDHWSVVSLLAISAAFLQIILLSLSTSMAFLIKRAKTARERE